MQCAFSMYSCINFLDVLDVFRRYCLSKKINSLYFFDVDRLSISPRKQLWIKAVKKLTSERLGREGLAAWGMDRTSNNDPEVPDINEITDPVEDADISTDPDVVLADQPVDAESQAQRGSITC